MIDPTAIDALRNEYDHCFACGRANPIGLGLDGFELVGDEVQVSFSPRPSHAGFADVLHGGIVATVLDEVLAWAGILIEGVLTVTGTLDIRFRRPAPPAGTYRLGGRVVSRTGSRLKMAGELLLGDDAVATAGGIYLVHRELT